MKKFKQYLKEDVGVEKLTHLAHLEDMPIIDGRDGAAKVLSILNALISKAKGVETQHIDITTKWDGSPSIICGTDPSNGKFFVATKSIFNKLDPKVNYTSEDIKDNHIQPELQKKLEYCLKYLKELHIKNIIQGDLLFVEGDVKKKEVDGVESFVFRPNTITYVVPVDSELGKKIAKAKVGIVFHTRYRGTDLHNLRASLDVDTTILKKTPDVWFENSDFQMIKSDEEEKISPERIKIIEKDMNNLKFALDSLDKVFLDKVESDSELKNLLLEFINYLVKTDSNNLPAKQKLELFAKYLIDKYSYTADERKTEKGKTTVSKKLERIQKIVKSNLKMFVILFAVHRIISDVKLQLIRGIKQKDDIKSYIDIDDKLVKSNPEGFVAVSDSYGTVKLNDRDTFNKHNFNLKKNWD